MNVRSQLHLGAVMSPLLGSQAAACSTAVFSVVDVFQVGISSVERVEASKRYRSAIRLSRPMVPPWTTIQTDGYRASVVIDVTSRLFSNFKHGATGTTRRAVVSHDSSALTASGWAATLALRYPLSLVLKQKIQRPWTRPGSLHRKKNQGKKKKKKIAWAFINFFSRRTPE